RELKRSTFTSEDFTNWNHWSFEFEDRIVVFHESKYLEFSRDTAFQLLYNGTQKMDEVILRKRLNTWQKEGDEWLLCTDRGLFSVFPRRIPFEHINTRSARGMIRQGNRYYFGGY